jgi:pyruvate,water dikinase
MVTSAGLDISGLFFWKKKEPTELFSKVFRTFRDVLDRNVKILELMADMGDKLSGEYVFDRQYILHATTELNTLMGRHVADLENLDSRKREALSKAFERIRNLIVEEEMKGTVGVSSFPVAFTIDDLPLPSRKTADRLGHEHIMMGEARQKLKLNTPDGLFLTTRVFSEFMAHNGLETYAEAYFGRLEKGHGKEAERALKSLRSLIAESDFPKKTVSGIWAVADRLERKAGHGRVNFAMRGCEWGKDRDSVPGMEFRTYLGVPRNRILTVLKDIISGFIGSSQLHYYPGEEAGVSVGLFAMTDLVTSGSLKTLDPRHPEQEYMIVDSTFGLGGGLKEGEGGLDRYLISRESPYPVLSMDVKRKDRMLTLRRDGETQWMTIPHYTCRAPSLRPDQIGMLSETAILMERYFKRPLDIVWGLDREDRLFILGVRPLAVPSRGDDAVSPVETAIRNAKVLFSGKGTVVQSGVAQGRVFVVKNDSDLDRFPPGAILVSSQSSPRFFRVIRKAKGIITAVGSATGHLAAMARDLRIPAIVNCGEDANNLRTGDEITIDASVNVVYGGAVKELQRFELIEEDLFEESEEYLTLRRILKHVSPLNLVDPNSPRFTPEGCLTYHDIMRYVHETAIRKVIGLSTAYKHRRHAPVYRLETDVPLGIFLAEIEERIQPGGGNTLYEKDVHSVPMTAMLHGLRDSGMWSTKPLSVDMGSFMSSLTRTFSYSMAAPEQVGMNLALVSEEYMNLNLRLGYHYTIIDALICDRLEENRISFRFFGGVTDYSRRSMRVRFIGKILETFDFRVELHGDLVIGRIKKASKSRMIGKMKLIGGLIGYTRQLDVQLSGERVLDACVSDFISKIKGTLKVESEQHDSL